MADLSTSEWTEVSKQRALVYGWFSTLYAGEIPKDVLASYLAGEDAPFTAFSVLGLDAEVQRIQAGIEALRDVDHAHLELAADFAQMFLMDAKAGALPYASVYDADEKRLYGPAEARMQSFLAGASLAVQDEFKEPADHLAVYLAVMARITEEQAQATDIVAAARDQLAFLEDALLTWLPSFNEANQEASPRYDVYPALAALLIAVVKLDAGFIREVAEHSSPVNAS
ncbi:molecular chaperone TorD [Aliiroseovarius sp. S1339]|uniref:molecular chaperone TorD n=1 Tax=Aliiroseovarius sp. S1339 TaxID=2936990 RepID=UPI0020C092F0|nr:molecular chaperone TorD [Aliiroseovarius sp. S1339]MCK8462900.1 molecular chaperone TorD [Aliiroseovarius sp. S1339]